MISVHYAVCSEEEKKPVVRGVVDTRPAADQLLNELRRQDGNDPTVSYWLVELGPESDTWRTLGTAAAEAS